MKRILIDMDERYPHYYLRDKSIWSGDILTEPRIEQHGWEISDEVYAELVELRRMAETYQNRLEELLSKHRGCSVEDLW